MAKLVALPWRFFPDNTPLAPRLMSDGSIAWYTLAGRERARFTGTLPTRLTRKLSADAAQYRFSFYSDDGTVPVATSQRMRYVEVDQTFAEIHIVEDDYRAHLFTRGGRPKTDAEISADLTHWCEHIKGAEIRAVAERLQREAEPSRLLAPQMQRVAALEAGLPDRLGAGDAPPILKEET